VCRALKARVAESYPAYGTDARPDTLLIARRDMRRPWREHLEYYSARDRTPRSTIGYGRHAQSVLFGDLHYQNQDRTSRFDAELPSYALRALSLELECVADVVAGLEFEGKFDTRSLPELYSPDVVRRVNSALNVLVTAGHLRREGLVVVDAGTSGPAITWLAQRFLPSPGAAPEPESLARVEVNEPSCAWSIHVEPAREGGAYYRVTGGLGLFYRSAESSLDGERTSKIMDAVVRQVERLVSRGVEAERIPEEIARFLEQRVGSLGIQVKVVRDRRRRHRLTVLAPS
jgi:hypothetical protein